jgi:hypothetical protein
MIPWKTTLKRKLEGTQSTNIAIGTKLLLRSMVYSAAVARKK